jgi:hypothetical protein
MDWKQVIRRWQALPLQEQARRRRLRIPLNVAESMAFEGEPVDQRILEPQLDRLAGRPVT